MATRVTPITSAVNRTPTNARRNARTQKINVTPTQSANNVGSTAAATNAVRSSNAVQSSNAATNVVRRSTAATNAVWSSTATTNAVQRSTAATNAVRSSTAATNSERRSTEVTVTISSQVTSPFFAGKNVTPPTAPKLTTKNPKQFSQTEPVLSVSKETIPFMSQTKQISQDTRTVAPNRDSATSVKGAASSTPKVFKPGFIERNTNGVAAKSTSLSVDNLKIILPVVAGSIILLVIFFVIIVVAVRRRRKKRLYLESTDESFATAYPGHNNGANADMHSGVNPFYRAEHQPSRPPPHMIQSRPSITTLESQQTPHFFFNTHGGGPSNTLDNVSEYTYYDGPPLPPKLRR